MQPITSNLLISFEGSNMSVEDKQYHKRVYSSIRVKTQSMSDYEQVQKFTLCLQCKMILTQEDKELICEWGDIDINRDHFSKEELIKIDGDPHNYVIWICRFCNKKNTIEKTDLRFSPNRCRVIDCPASEHANIQPIILIVFDTSGSMEESIFENQKGKEAENSKIQNLLNALKETSIYKKIVEEQKRTTKQFIQKHEISEKEVKFEDHLKKNKLLMSLTELAIQKIAKGKEKGPSPLYKFGKSVTNKGKSIKNKTIGFIFFNSVVCLQLNQKVVTVYDLDDTCKEKNKEQVNFQSFDSLFKVGQTYGQEYNTSLSQFKFTNLDLSLNNAEGQTALGPAIAIALGVISKHGPGSSIFVVTDGIANKGIFQETNKWDEQYNLLKMRLQRLKGFLAILEWRKITSKSEEINQKEGKYKKMNLDTFCKTYQNTIAQKINILFNENAHEKMIEDVQAKVEICLNRDNKSWLNDTKIRCQNPNISYDQSVKNQLYQKMINQNFKYHIVPKLNQKKLTQKDYVFPFMTQIIIKYENTKTGEQSIFMSYIIQKLVKFHQMPKKDKKALDNEATLQSVMSYLQSEDQHHNLENMQMSIIQRTFRQSIGQKSMRFTINHNHPGDDFIGNNTQHQTEQIENKIQDKNKSKASWRAKLDRINKRYDQQREQKVLPIQQSLIENQQEDEQVMTL